MEVIEHFCLGKNGDPSGGEDRIYIGQDFVAMFDGVTSRGRTVIEDFSIGGLTAGAWAAETLCEAVGSLHAKADIAITVEHLTEKILVGLEAAGVDGNAWGWAAAAQTVIYSNHRKEIWRVGDIMVALHGIQLPDTPTPVDEPLKLFRAAALEALLASGKTVEDLRQNDPTRQMLSPLLELQEHLRNHDERNNPFAYGLIDGRHVPVWAYQVIPIEEGDVVVFATDGYPCVLPTLDASEKHLADVLALDPLLFRVHRSFRPVSDDLVSYDDRAFLKFKA